MSASAVGSSPRIRGKFAHISEIGHCDGIIPANTGKISEAHGKTFINWDHPREYGENIMSGSLQTAPGGSSPRIRGKWVARRLPVFSGGIIPANTGKIYPSTPCPLHPWDHPREYGENFSVLRFSPVAGGSSPRIRGKCGGFTVCNHTAGIIPANTGKI